jgi:putative membrane protein (TIGR04086 family)
MAKNRKPAEPTGKAPFAHLRGLGFSLVFTAIFLVIISILVSATSLTESGARWFMAAAGIASVLIGSSQTGKRMGRAGWLNGGLTGLAYGAIMLILALLLDLGLTANSLITLGVGFAAGAAGGVWGVNRR